MSRYLLILFCVLSFISCTKPVTETGIPPAIQAVINGNNNCECSPVIDEYQFGSQLVYHHYFLGPACNTISVIYDKNGVVIGQSFDALYLQVINSAKFIRKIWRC
ncbi:MAG TPA: hypothetical protein VF487_03340 [Chitinophagaceae bacterium]